MPLKPESADPAGPALRQQRSKMFNELRPSSLATLEETKGPPGVPARLTIADAPARAEIPHGKWDTIIDTVVVGEVRAAQPYFSDDKKMLYTEYTVRVNDAVKAVAGSIDSSNEIALLELGGAIILPDGRILRHELHGSRTPLEVGQRYVLFLYYTPLGKAFRCIKAWKLKGGKATAMSADDVARVQQGTSRYNGIPESEFIAAIRSVLAGPVQ